MEDLKIKGDFGDSINSKESISVLIIKCTKNCAKEKEIDNFINKI